MMLRAFITVLFVLVPGWAFAWGPLTHMYLGSEALLLGSALIAPALSALINRFKSDFLYGNLMADSVLAKKYLPFEHHPHNWDLALRLYDQADTDSERAFCLGYLCHLAADTVAHGPYTSKYGHMGHTFAEFRADSFICHSHWFKAMSINKDVRTRNNIFLEKRLKTAFLSHDLNRGIFKGYVALSGIGTVGRKVKHFAGFRQEVFLEFGSEELLNELHDLSIERMTALLNDPHGSDVLELSAIATTPEKNSFFGLKAG
jgi:hypothetical protein